MADRMQVYKCEICGNIIEVLHAGKGVLVCCNQPMKLMSENTVDASLEKHVPVLEKHGDGVTVKVGSVPHPMEEKHYIEWIEVIINGTEGTVERQYLKPGQNPKASFAVKGGTVMAREYCNLHGLWKG
ncbi:MAG TPA: desulfoferrodoxin [Syntrophorhabdales bacterium]|nr:desulfoferrodoxin [Syntrophorhabdales bacterium]